MLKAKTSCISPPLPRRVQPPRPPMRRCTVSVLPVNRSSDYRSVPYRVGTLSGLPGGVRARAGGDDTGWRLSQGQGVVAGRAVAYAAPGRRRAARLLRGMGRVNTLLVA